MRPAACRCGHQPFRHLTHGCAGPCPCRVYIPAPDRCPSCDHEVRRHHASGCAFTVTVGQPGRERGCACTVREVAFS